MKLDKIDWPVYRSLIVGILAIRGAAGAALPVMQATQVQLERIEELIVSALMRNGWTPEDARDDAQTFLAGTVVNYELKRAAA